MSYPSASSFRVEVCVAICLVACISHHVGTSSLWRRLPSQPRVWVVAKTKKALLISNIYPDRLH